MNLGDGMDLAVSMVSSLVKGGASEAQVHHTDVRVHEINFDHEALSLVRSIDNSQSQLVAYVNGRRGTSSANTRLADEAAVGVGRALDAARASEADPGHAAAPGDPSAHVEMGSSEPDKETLLDLAVGFTKDLGKTFPSIRCDNCTLSFSRGHIAFANSLGVRRQDVRGTHSVGLMFTSKRGSHTSSFFTHRQGSFGIPGRLMDLPHLKNRLEEAVASLEPHSLDATFEGEIIFTPESLPTLLGALAGALGGQALLSGTTPYLDSEGRAIASEHLTFVNAPGDPRFPNSCGFDMQGVPARTTVVVEQGRLVNYLIDHYASRRLGRPQTSGQGNWIVKPGSQSVDEMVTSTKRGLILGRFSGGAPNANLDFSGIAKNSFYVEDGRIVGALGETMIAGNFQSVLRNIRSVSSETHNNGSHSLPHVASSGVTITAGKG